jgi:hypothetical protein
MEIINVRERQILTVVRIISFRGDGTTIKIHVPAIVAWRIQGTAGEIVSDTENPMERIIDASGIALSR